MNAENLLQVKDVSKIYTRSKGLIRRKVHEFYAVRDVSFDINFESPSILTIAGESGSGKTTIARLILRFIKPDKGEILYRGQNIWKMNKKELKNYRRKVQAVFQDPFAAFNPIYKVDHLLKRTIKNFKLARSDKEIYDILVKNLEFMRLRPEILEKFPHALSGGERQRIMLVRAILPKPDLVIADEPVSMLDTTIRLGVLEEILRAKKEYGISFIYITHDLATASTVGGNVLILFQGMVMEKGPIEKVLKEPIHPYTQLLVKSIPQPNPKNRFDFLNIEKAGTQESGALSKETVIGCPFYYRCPKYSEKCLSEVPKLFMASETDSTHWVRCHNTDDS